MNLPYIRNNHLESAEEMIAIKELYNSISYGESFIIPTRNQYLVAAKMSRAQHLKTFYQSTSPSNPSFLFKNINQLYSHTCSRPQYTSLLLETFQDQIACVLPSCRLPGVDGNIIATLSDHPVTQKILEYSTLPLAVHLLSQNQHPVITNIQTASAIFKEELPIFDGGRCSIGISPTILDCSNSGEIVIKRLGTISLRDIKTLLPDVIVREEIINIYSSKPFLHFVSSFAEIPSDQDVTLIGTHEKLLECIPNLRKNGYFHQEKVDNMNIFNIGSQTDFVHIAKNIHEHLHQAYTNSTGSIFVLPFSTKTHWARLIAQELAQFRYLMPFYRDIETTSDLINNSSNFYFTRLTGNLT